jgi:hypothetical protein
MKYIETPKGVVGFPDDMDDAAISSALSEHFNPRIGPFESGLIGATADVMTAGARGAQALGFDETAADWQKGAEERRQTVEKSYRPKVPSYKDIYKDGEYLESLGNLGQYIYEQGAQSLPYMAGMAGGALAGAAAAPVLGVGAGVAAGTGAVLGGVPLFTGSNIERQMKEGTPFKDTNLPAALGTAIIQSGLDATIARVLPGIGKAATGPLIARFAKKGVQGAGIEGLTESAQQGLEILQANPNKLWEFSPEVQAELMESAVAGGLLGGVLGGASGAVHTQPKPSPPVAETPVEPDEGSVGRVINSPGRNIERPPTLALPPPALVTPPPVTPENVFRPEPYGGVGTASSPEGINPPQEVAPAQTRDKVADTTGQKVYDDIFQQLLAAGVPAQEAIANSKLARARYERLAEIKGTDALTEWKSSNISIGKESNTNPILGQNRRLDQEVVGHRSALQRVLQNPPMKRGNSQQWLNFLKKNGIKDEELEWTGMKDALENNKGTFSSDDIRNMPMWYDVEKMSSPAGALSGRDMDFSQYTLGGYGQKPESNYRDVVLTEGPTIMRGRQEDDFGYQSSHWPRVQNPIAHYRTTDRTTSDGRSVLLTEEIQSDWHQAGQERGYRPSMEDRANLSKAARDAYGDLLEELHAARARAGERELSVQGAGDKISLMLRGFNEAVDPALKASFERYREALRARDRANEGVAPAPFKDTWPNLTFRHALLDAIENDKDYVAWTTGEQNVDRYWTKDDPEYSKKLKGMSEFYDKRLVNYANKLGKQFGTKVEPIEIGGGTSITPIHWVDVGNNVIVSQEGRPSRTFNTDADAGLTDMYNEFGQEFFDAYIAGGAEGVFHPQGGGSKVHGLKITPQLREWAGANPFSLFDKKKQVRAGVATFHPPSAESERKIVMGLTKYRTPSTVMHEFMHIWVEEMRRDAAQYKEIAQDLKLLMDWLGVDNPQKINRVQHEKLARAMEKYLNTGEAPTPALKAVFERFRRWISAFLVKMGQSPSFMVNLTPEVKAVLGRMLGGERVAVDPNTQLQPAPTGGGPLGGGHFTREGKMPWAIAKTEQTVNSESLDDTVLERLNRTAAGRAWQTLTNPLRNLPNQREYMINRMRTQGKADEITKFAEGLSNKIKTDDPKVMQEVYDYLTTRGADPKMISDEKLRTPAKNIKDTVNNISKELVRAGKLSVTSAANFHDQYLPRLYLKFLMEKKGMKASGIKVGDEGYTRQRKALTADEKKALGEIKDPSYLAYVAMTRPLRDLAVADMMTELTKHPEWVWQGSLVNYKGKMVTPYWLKAEAAEIRERMALEPDSQNKQDMERIASEMEAVSAQNNPTDQDYDQKDFTKIPDTRAYGPMRGAVVRKEIADDIKGMEQFIDPNNFMERWLGDRSSKLVKANQLWKEAKVVWNPPTQVRNFVSNLMLLHLSGVPAYRIPGLVAKAATEISKNGKHWQVAKKYGIASSTMTESELRGETDKFLKNLQTANQGKVRGSLNPIMKAFGTIREAAQQSYQFSEYLGKTMKIIDEMERNGKSEADAALEANKWLFDYSLVSPSVRYLRNAPLGMPFITFTTKVLPLLIESALTPKGIIRFGMYYALAQALPALVASMNDIDQDDIEKLRLALSERMRKRGDMYLLPFKDENNRWQFVDLGYFLPWQQYADFARGVGRGNPSDAAKSLGILSGPVPSVVSVLNTGIDPFTGQPVMDKRDPPSKQATSLLNYIWGLLAPPTFSQYGAIGRALEARNGTGVNRYGEPTEDANQLIARAMGLNINPVMPDGARARNILSMQYEIEDAKRRMNSSLRDQTLTPERRARVIEMYRDDIKKRYEKMAKYIRDSQPSDKLRAATARKD